MLTLVIGAYFLYGFDIRATCADSVGTNVFMCCLARIGFRVKDLGVQKYSLLTLSATTCSYARVHMPFGAAWCGLASAALVGGYRDCAGVGRLLS